MALWAAHLDEKRMWQYQRGIPLDDSRNIEGAPSDNNWNAIEILLKRTFIALLLVPCDTCVWSAPLLTDQNGGGIAYVAHGRGMSQLRI